MGKTKIKEEEEVESTKVTESKTPMDEVLKQTPAMPEVGSLISGTIIAKEKMAIYVDVPPFGTGIIYGREYLNARDIIKKVNIGDTITGKIVEAEGENGYIELSLKEAKQATIWSEADKAIKSKAIFEVEVKSAN